ncbi:hypothetical protein FAM09_01465 [Niastella caeni]|uniref:Uncharacterized protein n=1 Tax=Niastella caeni TaxID=2569763 RepID=A0A4S8HYC8_9BACT|nr:hypothetical protein [Niastella caeni]THU40808.1 hypothetical protein FAM09_01465 [Niastella caeni]
MVKSKLNKPPRNIFIVSLQRDSGITKAREKRVLQEIFPCPLLPEESDIIIVVIPSPGSTRRRKIIQKVGALKKSNRRLTTVVKRYILN